jgi:8-oxo-dGTP diphosphatase
VNREGKGLLGGAGVALRDDEGRLLLIRRPNGRWGCPGGRIEAGESFADCARRETREETGLEVELTGLLGVYSDPRYSADEDTQYLGVIFEGRIVGTADSGEMLEMGWFGPGELPEPLWGPDVPVIEDALSDGPRPFVR